MIRANAESPYVGPSAFEEADHDNFFGRGREVRQLLSLAVSRRVVLLYAASGAGKTSLLQAGLLPRLGRRGAVVLPVARVGGEVPPEAGEVKNVYVLSTLLYLLGEAAEPAELSGLELTGGLGRCLDGTDGPPFLVLDQLEELFTTHAEHYLEREDFLRQLRDALDHHPRLSLVLAIREDYLAHLDAFRAVLPDRLRNRMRLELLAPEAARRALIEPAKRAGVAFRDEAADALVDDLRAMRVQTLDGEVGEVQGPYVDPVQLQVVCHRLWERRPEGAGEIDTAQLAAMGSVDRALAEYYETALAEARGRGADERALRRWIDRHLVTVQGLRGQVPQDAECTQGLSNEILRALVDRHLLRAEARRGVVWLELAHDRLVQPIRHSNAAWLTAHRSTLERQAELWHREGRDAGLVLRGQALVQAERDAAGRDDLSQTERDFLSACRRDRYRTRRLARYAVAATLLALTVLVSWARVRAERESARTQALVAEARSLMPDRLDVALLLALEVERRGAVAAARRLLFEGLESSPRLVTLLHGHRDTVRGVAWSADGHLLASGTADGEVVLWDVAERRAATAPLAGPESGVRSLAWSADGCFLAAGGDSGELVLWPAAAVPFEAPRRIEAAAGEAIRDLAFHPGGRLLAAVHGDRVELWDVEAGRPTGAPLFAAGGRLSSAAWSVDGEALVAGDLDGTVHLWRTAAGEPVAQPLADHSAGVTSVAWSPDGDYVASGSLDGTVRLWQATSGKREGWPFDSLIGPVAAIAWSGRGAAATLAVGGLDGRVVWGDVRQQRPRTPPATGQTAALLGLALNPSGSLLASGHGRVVALWDTAAGPRLGRRAETAEPQAVADPTDAPRARSADGSVRASTDRDGVVRLSAGGEPAKPLTSFAEAVLHLALTSEGTLLAAATESRRIFVWDTARRELVAGPWGGHVDALRELRWSDDGHTLRSLDAAGTRMLWDVDRASWRERACRIANRDLTLAEWQRYLPKTRYRPSCAELLSP